MNQPVRKAMFMIFVGEPGTGKTTIMKSFHRLNARNLVLPANGPDSVESYPGIPELVPQYEHQPDLYRDPTGKKQRVVWYLPNVRTFQGTVKVKVDVFRRTDDKVAFFEGLCDTTQPRHCFTDGGLFIDDTKGYILSKGTLPELVSNMLIGRRHLMLDLFMAYHSFQDISGDLISRGPRFMIFRTTLPPNDTVLSKIQLREDLLDTIAFVNNRSQIDPHYYEPFDPVTPEANEFTRQHRPK